MTAEAAPSARPPARTHAQAIESHRYEPIEHAPTAIAATVADIRED